jgi:hypothetical protein
MVPPGRQRLQQIDNKARPRGCGPALQESTKASIAPLREALTLDSASGIELIEKVRFAVGVRRSAYFFSTRISELASVCLFRPARKAMKKTIIAAAVLTAAMGLAPLPFVANADPGYPGPIVPPVPYTPDAPRPFTPLPAPAPVNQGTGDPAHNICVLTGHNC